MKNIKPDSSVGRHDRTCLDRADRWRCVFIRTANSIKKKENKILILDFFKFFGTSQLINLTIKKLTINRNNHKLLLSVSEKKFKSTPSLKK
ncbi:hypothetical protein BpHYR1_004662 [Brachionus plicatilis]|uniref:Uncharacterized protein n=1 Tax=Brachionus plicatilis TaxID=10195 RepID=A0A3M7SIW5_BRAPC|nr:hypothetical protein BpHYR1_004662 [Brachionus plicatilis]